MEKHIVNRIKTMTKIIKKKNFINNNNIFNSNHFFKIINL